MFERIDHVGIAVDDFEAAIAFYESALTMRLVHRESSEEHGVEAALLTVGDGHVELLRPLRPETPVGRFLESHGPGLHHVAYGVADIAAELERLAAARVRLIDRTARPGIRGSLVAFLNPRSTGGTLVELVERR